MLIWKGHGFLIAAFGILGALVLGGAAWYLHGVTQLELLGRLVTPASAWGAALAIWGYEKTIGRPRKRMYLDAATQRPVVEHVSHSLFFISPKPWAVLTVVLASVLTVTSFITPVMGFVRRLSLASASPAQTACMEANRMIDTSNGKTGFGNTPTAEMLATVFSDKVQRERNVGVQQSEKASFFGSSNDKLLSYCRITPDSCAFMLHVPDLRNFDEAAKRYMVGLAWTIACKQAALLAPVPQRVVVGVRGASRYHAVVEGPVLNARAIAANMQSENWEDGIEQRYSDKEGLARLERCFEPQAPGVALPTLKSLTGSILALASSDVEPTLPTSMRDWKDSTGRVMRASLEGFTTPARDTGRFKRSDGRVFDVPFSRLCADDQATIRSIAAQMQ